MTWEWTAFAAMAVVFCGGVFAGKLPIGVALALAAVSGGLIGGLGLDPLEFVRQLSEGTLAYFDPTLYIVSAMIFMVAIERSGLLGTIVRVMLVAFHRSPILLLMSVTALVLFPGMMTGCSTAAVLSTGALVAPVLMKIGVSRQRTGAIIAMIAVYGLCAPPVNIPALIIGAGADIPYLGFGLPLFLMSVPLAMLVTLSLGLGHVRRVTLDDLADILPENLYHRHGLKLFLPLLLLVGLLIAERTLPGIFRQFGLPLIFLISAGAALVTGRRSSPWAVTQTAIYRSVAILAILMGVGMFIQMMTYTGARGAIAVTCAGMPRGFLYPIIGTSLPLFGAVSSFGAASVLGVPFVLSLLNQNVIITCAALSLCACLGDLMPPTALAGLFAAEVVGEKNYFRILRLCVPAAILTAVVGVTIIIFSHSFAGLALYDANSYGVEGAAEAVIEAPAVVTAGGFNTQRVITAIHWLYVGFLALSAVRFMWVEPSTLMKLSALMLAVPLTLRFLLVM